MAANYREFIPFVLKWEGGYVNDPADSGGATNRGITYRTYQALSKKVLKINPSIDHFKTLSKNEAALIFRYFWNKATYNNAIRSQAIAEAITSWFWGSGKHGLKLFQMMLNKRFSKNLTTDGLIGSHTVTAINSISEKELLKAAIEYRESFFRALAKKRPKDQRFLKGWLNRLQSFADRHSRLLASTGMSLVAAFFLAHLYM